MKALKNILLALALFIGVSSQAQVNVTVVPLTGGTVSNLLSGRYFVQGLTFYNQSTNIAILKFYDWATSATNVVRASYISILSYETNYTVINTNSAGILNTNTFTGLYSAEIVNAAVTNEQTRLSTVMVPGGITAELPLRFLVARGLTVLSDQTGTLQVSFRRNP